MLKWVCIFASIFLLAGCGKTIDEAAASSQDSSPVSSASLFSSEASPKSDSGADGAGEGTALESSVDDPENTYVVMNNTKSCTIKNLSLTSDLPGIALLSPNEKSAGNRWNSKESAVLRFDLDIDGKVANSIINYLFYPDTDVEIMFEETDKVYMRINTYDDEANPIDTVKFVYDIFYEDWVNITYGKLYVLTLPNEKLTELRPDLELSDFYPETTILFTYEPIYNVENLHTEDQYSQDTISIRAIEHLYDVFEPGEIMTTYVDHRRGIPHFIRYDDMEGNPYTLYLNDGFKGLPFPEVFADHIPEDWEIIYSDNLLIK